VSAKWDLDSTPIDVILENDVQQTIDFTERKQWCINGVSYWVTNGSNPLVLIEKIDTIGEPIEPDFKPHVSYKFSYGVAPYSTFVLKNLPPEPALPKSPRRKHLRLSPHAKLTKEILRRPNKHGKGM
jgi:hypothetical protein